MSKRIIQTTPSGEWGIPGVDLATLPPRVYGALCKLKDMESLLEVINSPTVRAWERDDAIEQLICMGKTRGLRPSAGWGLPAPPASFCFAGVRQRAGDSFSGDENGQGQVLWMPLPRMPVAWGREPMSL